MFTKVVIALAVFAVAHAGQEAPPQKSYTYNVPSVSKVAYPGPTVTKAVETYSAPSIEKTTTITRTITAPLNAPAVRHISYSAPSPPIVKSHAAPVAFAAQGYGAPAQVGYGVPVGYAAQGYAGPVGYAPIGYYAGPAVAPYAGPQGYAGGIGLATTYAAPALGYSLGGPSGYGAPAVALAAEAAPEVKYGAPAPEVVKKGGY